MVAELTAALKAIPAIVDGLKELSHSIRYAQDSRTDDEVRRVKQSLREELEAIKQTEDRDEILRRIHDLNTKLTD